MTLREGGRKLPTPAEIPTVKKAQMDLLLVISSEFASSNVKWAVFGELEEALRGVNVTPEEITILTDRASIGEIRQRMEGYDPSPVTLEERRLARDAELQGSRYPVYLRSYSFGVSILGQRVMFDADAQIKVGNWEWGEVLTFEPEYVYLVGTKIPIIPLRLLSDMYFQLGWLDKAQKVTERMVDR